MNVFTSFQRGIHVECLYGYSLTRWFPHGDIIICCLEKYLEVFDEKKIIRPNVVNSVVEGSIIDSKAKVLQIL